MKKSSEELLLNPLDQVPTYVFWKDMNGRYLVCNKELYTFYYQWFK